MKAVAVHIDKRCITWYQYAWIRSSLFHLI